VKFFTFFTFFAALPASAGGQLPIRFAFSNGSGVWPVISLQGANHGAGQLIRICGPEGKLCSCAFKDEQGNALGSTSAGTVSYEASGNYFRCPIPAGIAPFSVAQVELRGPGGATSGVLPLKTEQTLTLPDLIGADLDVNRVRSISRYTCESTYLQKDGTTPSSFDCTNQAMQCGTGSNFCLLRASSPYFLYADNYGSNFEEKPSDDFYNSSFGGLCGLQIRRLDCVSGGNPVAAFGLYEGETGFWKTAVSLPPAPDQPPAFVGYAAVPSPVTGECPPGLMPQVLSLVTVDTRNMRPSSNLPPALQSTDVVNPSVTPQSFLISLISGGNCDGSRCTMPNSFAGEAGEAHYSSAGKSVFCAIPAALLP
jgi:hypothetical protein